MRISIKILILSLVIFVTQIMYAQTSFPKLQDQSKLNTEEIIKLQSEFELLKVQIVDLKENYKLLYDGAENQNTALSNQIAWSNNFFGYLGIIIAILGIILATYIQHRTEEIREMSTIIDKTKKYIEGHEKDLFNRIRRDDTVSLLMRLIEVPEDIANVASLLFSRTLLVEDYILLRDAYFKVKGFKSTTCAEQYISVFLQHFPYEVVSDIEVQKEAINSLRLLMRNMFSKEIENLFVESFRYVKETGISLEVNKELMKQLFLSYFSLKDTFSFGTLNDDLIIKPLFINLPFSKESIFAVIKEGSSNENYLSWINSLG